MIDNSIRNKFCSSKFYPKSLTLLGDILRMIDQGSSRTHIVQVCGGRKSLVSYYIKRAKEHGYLNVICRDKITILVLSQQGKRFLDQSSKTRGTQLKSAESCCRAENVRLIAPIHRLPHRTPSWKRIEMNNWSQYTSTVDNIMVRYNDSRNPSIEFLPSPIDGDSPWQLCGIIYHECCEVARKLEELLDIDIGRLRFESGVEWVVYDPIAKVMCKYNGQITCDGLGKVNASKPSSRGEIEFFDPRRASEYFEMPERLSRVEKLLEEQNNLLNRKFATNNNERLNDPRANI